MARSFRSVPTAAAFNLCIRSWAPMALPDTALVLVGSTFFGTTYTGGNAGDGTIFSISTAGTGFQTLHFSRAAMGTGLPPD